MLAPRGAEPAPPTRGTALHPSGAVVAAAQRTPSRAAPSQAEPSRVDQGDELLLVVLQRSSSKQRFGLTLKLTGPPIVDVTSEDTPCHGLLRDGDLVLAIDKRRVSTAKALVSQMRRSKCLECMLLVQRRLDDPRKARPRAQPPPRVYLSATRAAKRSHAACARSLPMHLCILYTYPAQSKHNAFQFC